MFTFVGSMHEHPRKTRSFMLRCFVFNTSMFTFDLISSNFVTSSSIAKSAEEPKNVSVFAYCSIVATPAMEFSYDQCKLL